MPRTSIEPLRHVLSGATMGTRWSAVLFLDPGAEAELLDLELALAGAADEVDRQMSTWKPQSDLMRLNRAAPGDWVALPAPLVFVLARALEIGRLSGGAFDIGLGTLTARWGFGPRPAGHPGEGRRRSLPPAHDRIEVDVGAGRARRLDRVQLDLSGIAKGFGVDRMAEAVRRPAVRGALLGIDGEMRAIGHPPGAGGFAVGIEAPDPARRAALAVIELADAAVATSGDYRQVTRAGGRDLSHVMDRQSGAPVDNAVASVTVLGRRCLDADAWATALMVLGPEEGPALARRLGLEALFLLRVPGGLRRLGVGPVFGGAPALG